MSSDFPELDQITIFRHMNFMFYIKSVFYDRIENTRGKMVSFPSQFFFQNKQGAHFQ